ncbi:hypothetical protein OJ996_04220 [Luteolibacter sp. GHJ8]|uniref:Uncharacterized protein n=1 Tax=Luteolibacter rhizosphaerae TaxID=2989719 RepID=A0ABT3FZV4_9BACT|nr:hypothetical protein [Luteolibacter rhizosphaerae]MCW1912764.1 hypothetical protein [Luteolibacter rhizosphaerae]
MDPYAPPLSPALPADDQRLAMREIVVGWERLRLLYNAILAVPGLLVLSAMTGEYGMPALTAVLSAVFVAVGANLCFLLGPLAELYLRGIFRRGQPLGRGRWLLFGSGTLLSLFLFVLTYSQMTMGWP